MISVSCHSRKEWNGTTVLRKQTIYFTHTYVLLWNNNPILILCYEKCLTQFLYVQKIQDAVRNWWNESTTAENIKYSTADFLNK